MYGYTFLTSIKEDNNYVEVRMLRPTMKYFISEDWELNGGHKYHNLILIREKHN